MDFVVFLNGKRIELEVEHTEIDLGYMRGNYPSYIITDVISINNREIKRHHDILKYAEMFDKEYGDTIQEYYLEALEEHNLSVRISEL